MWVLFVALTVWAVLYDVNSKKIRESIINETISTSQSLTLEDLKTAFAKKRLTLTSWTDKTYYKLNGIEPKMFKAIDGEFAIYVFKSEDERKKGREDFSNQTATAKVKLSHIYEVKNVLVFEVRKPSGSGFKVNEILANLNEVPLKLELYDVYNAVRMQGIELQQTGITIPYFQLGSVNGDGYKINDKEQLYIYVFNSKEEVDAGLKQIETRTATMDFAFSPVPFKVHNVLIMYLRYSPTQGLEKEIQKVIYGVDKVPLTSTLANIFS